MSKALVEEIISQCAKLSEDERSLVMAALAEDAETVSVDKGVDLFGKFAHVPKIVEGFSPWKAAEIHSK